VIKNHDIVSAMMETRNCVCVVCVICQWWGEADKLQFSTVDWQLCVWAMC